MSRIHAALFLATLAACTSRTSPHPIGNTSAPPGSLGETLERAKTQHGDVLLVSADDGITAYTPDLVLVAKLTTSAGRYVHADPEHRALFYFVERRLVRLDLATGQEHTVATLPALRHMCFGHGDDGANPIDHIQRDDDVVVDVAHGFACLNVQDRNINMMSVSIAYRVALDTGAVIQKTTFTLDDCREPGEVEQSDGPCVAGDQAGPSPSSSSKRWELVRDPDLGEQGDYIYSATFVTDKQTSTTYAIRPDGIAKLDYAAARAAGKAPEGTCLLPYEALVRWFPHAEVLLVTGCSETALLVRPPASVRKLPGNGFAFY
jgi:hypothetical protein